MNKSESKYYNTALLMDEALLALLQKKEFEYITVKEVCKKAGVNRSTFYLHYDGMPDLLDESIEMIYKRFQSKYEGLNSWDAEKSDKTACFFITPEYLAPYLSFVKENKKIFRLICEKPGLFRTRETFEKMYERIFCPILEKYSVEKSAQPYVFAYYFGGISSVITDWVKRDCDMTEKEMIYLITSFLPERLAGKNE